MTNMQMSLSVSFEANCYDVELFFKFHFIELHELLLFSHGPTIPFRPIPL